MKPDENYVCGTCANPPPVDDTPKVIEVDGDEFDIVPQFCYLGDMCGERGGYTDAVTARIRAPWKDFSPPSPPSLLTEVLVTLVEEMCSPHVSVVFFSMEVKLRLCPRKTYCDCREATML